MFIGIELLKSKPGMTQNPGTLSPSGLSESTLLLFCLCLSYLLTLALKVLFMNVFFLFVAQEQLSGSKCLCTLSDAL